MTKKGTDEIFYRPLDGVLVRAPLLPIESYGPGETATAREGWPEVAIAIGSPTLARASATPRSRAPLRRFGIRMSTRPTPYGLFAGVSLAQWCDATTMALAAAPPHTRTRPDMGWLLRLAMDLESRPEIRKALTLHANSTALIRGGRILLMERLSHSGDGKAPPRVSVRATAVARLVLELARQPIPYAALLEALAAEVPNVNAERIEQLVQDLIDQSLLLTDLRPPLTCAAPAHWLAVRLAAIPAARDVHERLADFLRAIDRWDGAPVAERAVAYRKLAARAVDLGARSDEIPLQVDTVFPLAGDRIHRAVGEEIARAASLMLRLSPFPHGFPYLKAYQQAFVAKYGEHREVPLLELIDPFWGLGPPDPNGQAGWIDFQGRDQALVDLACDALRGRRLSVTLDDALLKRLDTRQHEPAAWPTSLDICAFVCARPGGIDRGEFKVVIGPNIGAPCSGRNIGRFADILGNGGRAAARLAAEASTDPSAALVAEIVYLPHSFRLANVAIRPPTRAYEIAIGLSAGVDPAHEIPVDELTIGVDKEGFYLRWAGHADRVVITSSHMLNFLEAPPLCRFLAHMQADRQTQLHVFDWGPASRFPFLPRVEAGKVVLRPAEWRIGPAASDPAKTADGFREFLRRHRQDWLLPRHVYLSSGDVRLLLDLDDPDHADELRRDIRRLKPGMHVLLQEALPGLDDAWLPGPGGHYIVELVVSLMRGAADKPPQSPVVRRDNTLPRIVSPGSDWLFVKLYGSREAEEDLLTGPVSAFLDNVAAAGLSSDCFFVRYSDPDPHLRLRCRTPTPDDANTMLIEICALGRSLLDQDLCTRFAIDSYEREIERYGGPTLIGAAEDLFVADSQLVLGLLRLMKRTTLQRDAVAALMAYDLADALGLDDAVLDGQPELLRTIRQESGASYRQLKASLAPFLDNPTLLAEQDGNAELQSLMARRRVVALAFGGRLRDPDLVPALTNTPTDICHTFLHMHCNRLIGRDRAEERKVLGLMFRLREARRARVVSAKP